MRLQAVFSAGGSSIFGVGASWLVAIALSLYKAMTYHTIPRFILYNASQPVEFDNSTVSKCLHRATSSKMEV